MQDTCVNVAHDDGDTESLDLRHDTGCFASSPIAAALTADLPSLGSSAQHVIAEYLSCSGNTAFVRPQAQDLRQHALHAACRKEEDSFKQKVEFVSRSSLFSDATFIRSHVIYKVKVDDDSHLHTRSRIAPHGNEESVNDYLRTDHASCAPTWVRIVQSVCMIRKWALTQIDAKSSFFQTGSDQRAAYVIPPCESADKRPFVWLLQPAAYCLVNANGKWHSQSDNLLRDCGLTHVGLISKLSALYSDTSNLRPLLAKNFDDMLLCGPSGTIDAVISSIIVRFTFGTVTKGPGFIRFFGLKITQNKDHSIIVHADGKLMRIELFPHSGSASSARR